MQEHSLYERASRAGHGIRPRPGPRNRRATGRVSASVAVKQHLRRRLQSLMRRRTWQLSPAKLPGMAARSWPLLAILGMRLQSAGWWMRPRRPSDRSLCWSTAPAATSRRAVGSPNRMTRWAFHWKIFAPCLIATSSGRCSSVARSAQACVTVELVPWSISPRQPRTWALATVWCMLSPRPHSAMVALPGRGVADSRRARQRRQSRSDHDRSVPGNASDRSATTRRVLSAPAVWVATGYCRRGRLSGQRRGGLYERSSVARGWWQAVVLSLSMTRVLAPSANPGPALVSRCNVIRPPRVL